MATGDYLVNDADLALLRSPSQRFTLKAAILPAYTPTVTQRLRGVSENMRDAVAWTPDHDFGPNKVGVVGTAVSYYLGNSADRAGGAIAGANKSIDWGDGTPIQSPVDGAVSHVYAAAGTYELIYTVTDPTSGVSFGNHRWVKIYATWASAYDGIAEVSSLSASSTSGGWTASLRVTKTTGTAATGDFPDRACVVLYVDQTWHVGGRGAYTETTRTPNRSAGYEYDPNYLFVGYVVGNTVRVDSETNSITFEARTAEYFLQQMFIYEHRFLDSTEDGYGHVVTGLTLADALNHLLYQHTNWATWHGFSIWRQWPDANVYKQITFNQGSIWGAIQSFAGNEFARVASSRFGDVMVSPDVNVRGLVWWGVNTDPPELPFDESNCLGIEVTESQLTVGAVEIRAANPYAGTTLTATYPETPGNVGERLVLDGLTCEVQGNLDLWAERLYYARNARYRVSVQCAMPKVLDLNQLVVVDYADPQGRVDLTADVGGGAMRKPFYVEDVSYSVDLVAGTWLSRFTLGEIVRVRWNLTTQKWQTYDGSVWSDA